jgi:hypothetical protein
MTHTQGITNMPLILFNLYLDDAVRHRQSQLKIVYIIYNLQKEKIIKTMLHQWKESIVVPIHKKGDKTDCSNYRGISSLSTSYKMLSNILFSRLIRYVDEIIGDH